MLPKQTKMTNGEYNELMMEDAYKMLVGELTKAQECLCAAVQEIEGASQSLAACGEVANKFFEQTTRRRKHGTSRNS